MNQIKTKYCCCTVQQTTRQPMLNVDMNEEGEKF